jgi:transposase InsO family protein
MPNLDPSILKLILSDWSNAPFREKRNVLEKWADKLKISTNTLYRHIKTGRKRKATGRRIENIEAHVNVVCMIKKKPPEQHGEIKTAQAIKIAVKNGLIPKDMMGKTSTFDRIMRDLGMNKKKRRVQRYQAEYPNQLHHVDASSSKFFFIHRETEDKTDYVLRLHAGTKGYKNKPVPIRLRPWLYGLTDDCSGVFVARYIAAYGESAVDNLEFIEWAWGKNDDKPFFGLPDKIKGDFGPMMRGPDTKDFFARLCVDIDPSTPENKDAHGKIERPWRTVWQSFETPFFAQHDWRKFEITLSELNDQFLKYQQEYNDNQHRYEKDITRLDAWKRINFKGGAVAIPENALSTIARRHERTVGADGCLSLDNVLYEVKGLHDAKVYVYTGIFENKMIVEDKSTGKKYDVEKFSPNPLGTFTAHKEIPHQKAIKAAKDLVVVNTLFSNQSVDSGNVRDFPTRIKETRAVKNPLSVDTLHTIDDAMALFTSICGFMIAGDDRKTLEKLIIKNGLKRSFIINTAHAVVAENERMIQNG